VNSATGYNFSRTLNGVELGRSALGLNWNVSASEGGSKFNFVALANLMYMWDKFGPFNGAMLGGSFARAESTLKPGANRPTKHLDAYTYALYGGFSIGDFTAMVQGTLMDGDTADTTVVPASELSTNGWIVYTEAN